MPFLFFSLSLGAGELAFLLKTSALKYEFEFIRDMPTMKDRFVSLDITFNIIY